jgi:hypothetical protein
MYDWLSPSKRSAGTDDRRDRLLHLQLAVTVCSAAWRRFHGTLNSAQTGKFGHFQSRNYTQMELLSVIEDTPAAVNRSWMGRGK